MFKGWFQTQCVCVCACVCVCVCAQSLSCVQLFATPWSVTIQVPLSMEFSRQEYWSGLPFPLSGILPDPRIEPASVGSSLDSFQHIKLLELTMSVHCIFHLSSPYGVIKWPGDLYQSCFQWWRLHLLMQGVQIWKLYRMGYLLFILIECKLLSL